jgi:hypothetical protein
MATIAHNVTIDIHNSLGLKVASSLNADTLLDGWMVRVQCTVLTGLPELKPDQVYTIKRPNGGGDWVNMYCEEGAKPAQGNFIVGGGVAKFRNRKNKDNGPDLLSTKLWKF